MAIGAGRSDVMKMVLRQGLTLSLSGILVGSVLSVAAGRWLALAWSVSAIRIRPPMSSSRSRLIALTIAASLYSGAPRVASRFRSARYANE